MGNEMENYLNPHHRSGSGNDDSSPPNRNCGNGSTRSTMKMEDAILIKNRQEEACKNGNHRFVECDKWEPTCIFCGEFDSHGKKEKEHSRSSC